MPCWLRRMLPLAAVCLLVGAGDVEGSGGSSDDLERFLPPADGDSYDQVMIALLDRPPRFEPIRLNSTLQLELIRAEEELFRGRLGLTLWIHQSWTDANYAYARKGTRTNVKQLKLPLEVLLPKVPTPQTVIKNALYFKEHRTPMLNGFVTLDGNGTFSSHLKITVDLPCIRNYGNSHGSTDENFPLCARGSMKQNDYRYGETVCELRYGSYIRDQLQLQLSWHFNAILTQSIPCSGGGKPINACSIRETQLFSRTSDFAGFPYDELVACFVLDQFGRT